MNQVINLIIFGIATIRFSIKRKLMLIFIMLISCTVGSVFATSPAKHNPQQSKPKVNCHTMECFKKYFCEPMQRSVNKELKSLAAAGKVKRGTVLSKDNCTKLLSLPGVVANPCGKGNSCYKPGQNKTTLIEHICSICLHVS